GILFEHRHEDHGPLSRMLKLIEPAEHAAGVQSVNRAQILAPAIGESLRLLFRMSEAKPGGGGHAIDEKDAEGSEPRQLGVLHHVVIVCLRIGESRRQGRVEPAKDAGKISAFGPGARTQLATGRSATAMSPASMSMNRVDASISARRVRRSEVLPTPEGPTTRILGPLRTAKRSSAVIILTPTPPFGKVFG